VTHFYIRDSITDYWSESISAPNLSYSFHRLTVSDFNHDEFNDFIGDYFDGGSQFNNFPFIQKPDFSFHDVYPALSPDFSYCVPVNLNHDNLNDVCFISDSSLIAYVNI